MDSVSIKYVYEKYLSFHTYYFFFHFRRLIYFLGVTRLWHIVNCSAICGKQTGTAFSSLQVVSCSSLAVLSSFQISPINNLLTCWQRKLWRGTLISPYTILFITCCDTAAVICLRILSTLYRVKKHSRPVDMFLYSISLLAKTLSVKALLCLRSWCAETDFALMSSSHEKRASVFLTHLNDTPQTRC